MTDKEAKDMTEHIDKSITEAWMGLIEAAHELRVVWQRRSAPQTTRRETFEAGREIARVILRAWREVTDKVRAGAAANGTTIGTPRGHTIDRGWLHV